MEDFLLSEPISGRAAFLVEHHQAVKATFADTSVWLKAAEDCVMMRIRSRRIIGGLPRHKAPLTRDQRIDRLQNLLRLWACGCTSVVDEDLFADIVKRHEP